MNFYVLKTGFTFRSCERIYIYIYIYIYIDTHTHTHTQSDSVARGPKLLSIKNYVIEIMT